MQPVPFDHPLCVLFSSGTTGLPKGIVHGHGGVLLEHLVLNRLHLDLGPDDTFFWYTTTNWTHGWNVLVSGLLAGSTIVAYDGSPSHPDAGLLWRLLEKAPGHRLRNEPRTPAVLRAGRAPPGNRPRPVRAAHHRLHRGHSPGGQLPLGAPTTWAPASS